LSIFHDFQSFLVAAVCDEDYPRYVAFTALKEVLDVFSKSFGEGWKVAQADKVSPCPGIVLSIF
jgi:hypothetical protein